VHQAIPGHSILRVMGRGGSKAPDAVEQITIVIADDHRSYGEALQIALGAEADLTVIEVVDDGTSVVEAASADRPDVVLMDLQLPGVDGIEATRRIRQENPDTDIIILTGRDDDISLARAIEAGARGLVSKTEAISDVAQAIRRAHRGEPLHRSAEVEQALKHMRTRRAIDGNLTKRVERLTPRELEILQEIANGLSPEQIATELGMSRHTLRTHTQNILTKLGVHSKTDAVVAAIRFGKIQTDEVAPEVEPEATEEP
jgi:DNA-binding NarL/FixJ family response regulator